MSSVTRGLVGVSHHPARAPCRRSHGTRLPTPHHMQEHGGGQRGAEQPGHRVEPRLWAAWGTQPPPPPLPRMTPGRLSAAHAAGKPPGHMRTAHFPPCDHRGSRAGAGARGSGRRPRRDLGQQSSGWGRRDQRGQAGPEERRRLTGSASRGEGGAAVAHCSAAKRMTRERDPPRRRRRGGASPFLTCRGG